MDTAWEEDNAEESPRADRVADFALSVRALTPDNLAVPRYTRREGYAVAEIRAEMVANVWKVTTSSGTSVSAGGTVLILESMKMEIPVVSDANGTVCSVKVAEGDVVQEGDLLAVVE